MKGIWISVLSFIWGAAAASAAAPTKPPVTLAELQTTLKTQPLSRGEVRLQATGQLRAASGTASLRKYATDPKADPAVKALYSREGQFYESGTPIWLLIPDTLFNYYRSDIAADTLLRAYVLMVEVSGNTPLLLLEGYEVTGHATAPAGVKLHISGSSSK